MADAAVLLGQAMTLSPEDRENLALQILLSVEEDRHPSVTKNEFVSILNDRIQQIENGDIETVDAFEAINRIRERLKSR